MATSTLPSGIPPGVQAQIPPLRNGDHLDAYRDHGAREYLAWPVEDRAIDWFSSRDGRFKRLEPGGDGILRSTTFPGLWLEPAALIDGDMGRVLETLHLGLASPEHAGFVARLREAAGGGERT